MTPSNSSSSTTTTTTTTTTTRTLNGTERDETLSVNAGIDTLNGRAGNDTLNGGEGGDTLNGDAGDDTLNGGKGVDTLNGGTGNDILNGGEGVDTLNGGKGNDTLNGDDGVDTLRGNAGDDILNGGDGRDDLFGGDGADVLNGGAEGDDLDGDAGDDILNGGEGGDTLNGGTGVDTLNGDKGNDILNGDAGDDILNGGEGVDTMKGGIGDDILDGGAENDVLHGDEGDDVLDGGKGNDELYGGDEADHLSGGGGDDTLKGDAGNDTLNGGEGDDKLYGGTENDTLNGDEGDDKLYGDAGNDTLNGGVGVDTLYGGKGGDTLNGDEGDDKLYGGEGNDILNGGSGADTLTGGKGNDWFTLYQGVRAAGISQRDANGISQLDVVTDFKRDEKDKIHIDELGHIGDLGDIDGLDNASLVLKKLLALKSLRIVESEDRITRAGEKAGVKDTVIYATNRTDATDDDVALMVIADVTGLSRDDFTKPFTAPLVTTLSNPNGKTEFRLDSALRESSGTSVSSAGDVNGDGYDDIIVGAPYASNNGSYSGSSYVVFGKADGFDKNLKLSSLNGTNGFRLDGQSAGDTSGMSVSSAGDVNGDGFDDVVIGAYSADNNRATNSGSSYVVFGKKAGDFDANIKLSSLNGTNGFRLDGKAAGDYSGYSVSSAGDVNGDGFDDVVIGAYNADNNRATNSGSSYVVFGEASGFSANINLFSLDGTKGFRLDGENAGDFSGWPVSSAGDVNGDGFDDVIVGAHYADNNGRSSGSSYVVFGKASGFSASLKLSSLNGTNGFRLDGETEADYSGRSVSSAGDVNGDGFDDVIIGAGFAGNNGTGSGSSYVVFGKASGFSATVNLSSLDGTNGFRLDGEAADDLSGSSVSSAGDFNGDGYDDVIIGTWINNNYRGSSYVVFGKASGFSASLNLSSLIEDGTNGFRLDGGAAGGFSGYSVSGAGDVNGDGYDDVIVGAPYAGNNGVWNGSSYVVFGYATSVSVIGSAQVGETLAADISGRGVQYVWKRYSNDDHTAEVVGRSQNYILTDSDRDHTLKVEVNYINLNDDRVVLQSDATGKVVKPISGDSTDLTITGTAGIDTLNGGVGDDTLNGGAGIDTLNGRDGNDTLNGGAGIDTLDGGAGHDRLFGQDGNDTLKGSSGNDRLDGGAGVDTLDGGAGDDILNGGAGADILTGGGGNDWFTLYQGDRAPGISQLDVVTNFVKGEDKIYIDDLGGASSTLAELLASTSLRIAKEDRLTGTSNKALDDTVIYATNGTEATDDDVALMVIVDVELELGDFIKQPFTDPLATINLSSLNGKTGFRLDGAAAGDLSGHSVSSAGDVNGDGYIDVVIGAHDAGDNDRGSSYVVFGKASGFDADLNLSSLNGINGFRLDGKTAGDESGKSVSSAGDVNGDGFDDLIVGADWADNNSATNSGSSYVVFGKKDGFSKTLNLSSLDGSTGFRLDGEVKNDYSGYSVSSAGDVNNDGYDDLIIGAPNAGNNDRGSSYIVFGKGKDSSFDKTIKLPSLDAAVGFRIDGEAIGDYSGFSVSSAGDVNGDGYDDVIIGAYGADNNGNSNSGSSYVVFGKASGFSAKVTLSSLILNGTKGFRLDGETAGDRSGSSVSSAGDVNGDGFDDLIIGAPNTGKNSTDIGSSYVVFGRASGFSATNTLSSLIQDGTKGFRLDGAAPGDKSGSSVSSAGDFNGDGFDDIIIGAHGANNNSNSDSNIGSSYVVFGKAGGFDANINLSDLNGSDGFRLDGKTEDDESGKSVSSAGDVNDDGFDDIIVGADNADNNGNSNSGSSYIVFGYATSVSVMGSVQVGETLVADTSGGDLQYVWKRYSDDDYTAEVVGSSRKYILTDSDIGKTLRVEANYINLNSDWVVLQSDATGAVGKRISGDSTSQTITGTAGNDILHGNSGFDTLTGGAGNDTLNGGEGWDTLNGGAGDDVYVYDQGGRDTITDAGGKDQLRFGSFASVDDVTYSRTGDDLKIALSNNYGSDYNIARHHNVTITNWMVEANRIEEIIFDDGTIKTYEDILADINANTTA